MTRKSRFSYRTLLRPKYCASATLAAASTTKRDTDAAVNRAMGTPAVLSCGGATLARSPAGGEPSTIRLKVQKIKCVSFELHHQQMCDGPSPRGRTGSSIMHGLQQRAQPRKGSDEGRVRPRGWLTEQ